MSEAVKFEALQSSKPQGALKIIGGYKKGPKITTYLNDEKTEESLEAGTEVIGRYEGRFENRHPESGDVTVEYRIRQSDETLVIVKGTVGLNDEETGLAALTEGELVMLVFNGMKPTKSGRKFASFTVNRAVNADN